MDLTSLEVSFTMKEIKAATFELGVDKTPGLTVSQSSSRSTGPSMICLNSGNTNLERINWASVSLIPKMNAPRKL